MRYLLLIFILVPILEMWLLIKVGGIIGAWPTIGLVLLTAVVGVALLRREGAKTLLRGNQRLERGELPATEMAEGLVLAVCGALLLTPGFATDVVGFFGLVPVGRRWLIRRLAQAHQRGSVQFGFYSAGGFRPPPRDPDRDRVIEAEYWREDDPDRRS